VLSSSLYTIIIKLRPVQKNLPSIPTSVFSITMPDNTNHALNAQSVATAVVNAIKTVAHARTQETINKVNAPHVGKMLQAREEIRSRTLEQNAYKTVADARTQETINKVNAPHVGRVLQEKKI
jgi:hypothetical protein